MFSEYAVKCGNCRCEYDTRSFKDSQQQPCCPSCGYLLSHQQMTQQQARYLQQQMMGAQQQMNTLSNQMNGGLLGGLGNAGLSAGLNQLAQAQFKPDVKSGIPELDEYDKRVKAIKVELPTFKEAKMFGLWKQRTELRIEIERLAKDLEHHKKNEEMRIAEAVQKQRLSSNEEIAKIKLAAEKQIADAQNKAELTLTTLQGKFTRDKAEQDAKYAKDLAEAKTKAAEDYYNKMTAAMTELHQNGDKNSKFIQELALSMVKKAPRALGNTSIKVRGSVKDLKALEQD